MIARRLTRIDLIGLAILIALIALGNYFGVLHDAVAISK
jgi:hypothetical protein